jgi:hypothetical protein
MRRYTVEIGPLRRLETVKTVFPTVFPIEETNNIGKIASATTIVASLFLMSASR